MKATAEFHPGAVKKNNGAGRFYQSVKRGGTAEVDAYRFRPQKGINLYGAKWWAFFICMAVGYQRSAVSKRR